MQCLTYLMFRNDFEWNNHTLMYGGDAYEFLESLQNVINHLK